MGRYDDLKPPPRTAEPPATGPLVDLSDKEAAAYSITRAMEAVCAIGGTPARTLETEVSDELDRQLAPSIMRQGSGNSVWVPTDPRIWLQHERALLEVQTANKGGELVFTGPGGFLPMLRGKSLVVTLGAQVLTGLRGKQRFQRQLTKMSATWVAESPTADVGASALTMEGVPLAPKGLLAVTSVTRMLAQQSRPAADRVVMDELRSEFGTTVDKAAIQGTGTLQPVGILNTAGINTVTIGPNGGAPTYDHLVDMEFEVAVDDADLGSLGLLTTPKVRQKLRKSAAISASSGVPAWVGNQVLGGIRADVTTNVPSNLTKGTSTTICHAIIFGNWADLVIGEWGALEIIVDPFALKRRGDLEISAILHTDVGVLRPTSFAAALDAIP